MILDSGRVRLQWSDGAIFLEELPRKPCKKSLRSLSINTWYAVQTMHRDDYIPSNVLGCPSAEGGKSVLALLDRTDSYELIATLIRGALASLGKRPGNADVEKIHAVTVHAEERHYSKVTPEGVEQESIECRDFTLTVSWTRFSAYSPNSDFQLSDPHYTQVHETSPASARKLYKLAREKRAEVAALSWDAFTEWLRGHKVAFDYSFSQWT
jgi:hypothetical protein